VRERPVEIARAEQKVSYAEAVKRVEDYGSMVSSMPRPIQRNTSLCFSKVGFLAFIAMVITVPHKWSGVGLVGGAMFSFYFPFLFKYCITKCNMINTHYRTVGGSMHKQNVLMP
jgi:hypothetical protein